MSTADNQSYLAKLSPWGARSPAIKPSTPAEPESSSGDVGLRQTQGSDHKVTHRHRLSSRNYPKDCPPLLAQWFFATDVPKRRPSPLEQPGKEIEKPRLAPKKYAPFSKTDSKSIEAAFRKIAKDEDAAEQKENDRDDDAPMPYHSSPQMSDNQPNASFEADEDHLKPGAFKVPVNEDYLFDVDVERRELAPAYWLGPVYEIRRGTWFYQDGSVQRPCDENLAAQLEEGYLKLCPWREIENQEAKQDKEERAGRAEKVGKERSASQPRSSPVSLLLTADPINALKIATSTPVSPRASSSNLREQSAKAAAAEITQSASRARTLRLFGPHSNSVVTYQDATTAWILTDDFISRMSSTMYQRFAGGGHFAGVKVTRGYVDPTKKAEDKDGKPDESADKSTAKDASQQRGAASLDVSQGDSVGQEGAVSPSETRRQTLERQMSSLVSAATKEDREKEEEEIRKRDEKEIQDDYRDQDGEEQNREIEHLLLVTHGIGQRLGLRMDSVNFVHDVNTFRKTLKAVYNESPDLQALNSEVNKLPKNCRIQVLPINWRHKLDFPKQSLKHNRREHDLGDAGFGEEEDYPNLDDISVEGVPAVRNLITDLALDILLYQSPAYKDHISRIVLEECNRIYKLFKERNPTFSGKVSLVGHSLGSAIMFDILCMQEKQELHHKGSGKSARRTPQHQRLDFEVEDFYALGSPVGLFQMLKGRTIAAREAPSAKRMATEASRDPFSDDGPLGSSSKLSDTMGTHNSEIPVSSPHCRQLFNIFHPTDPISYRIEPLISPAMASLKPQPLPYTKRGIFGSQVGQGLTGIGARVGQSVSGLWSSFSSGIASSLLNRSLGFTAEDASKLGGPSGSTQSRTPLSLGAGTNAAAGLIPTAPAAVNIDKIATGDAPEPARDEPRAGEPGQHPPTLIDSELETLYAGFQNRRKSGQADEAHELGENVEWAEAEERGRKLRKEEAKVRALNLNGRVDYSIQEGAFDISLIAAVASHLSYWADEDVSHFMISQLLSRQRVVRKSRSVPDTQR